MDPTTSLCFHCGGAVSGAEGFGLTVDGVRRAVCCAACETAAKLILAQGLGRFYEFRATGAPVPDAAARNWSVFDREIALQRYTHELPGGEREVSLQLEGLHCAACAWLIENSLSREPGMMQIHVNASRARVELRFDPRMIPLSRILRQIQSLGFSPLPLSYTGVDAPGSAERRAALKRLAVAGFGMMQLMTYAVSLYVGAMQDMAPDLQQFLRFVSLAVATPVVLYSAQPFFVSAWLGVRSRVLGMDVPVALSIGAAYLWSVCSTIRGSGAVYFDSAVMFTFFLLLGRYIEMSLRHRCGMQHDALARLLPESVQRLGPASAENVTPDELRAGDRVRVLPGERVPADGRIERGESEVDESLLTGEAAARVRRRGDLLIAGTLNLTSAVEMTVTRVGQDSTLATMSRLLERAHAARPPVADVADRVAAWFVGAVLLLAAGTALYWAHADVARAFPATLAVLVITCPCALSLATPAALAAATTRLARSGILITRGRALERLASADRIVLDKTGTLTRGEPHLDDIVVPQARVARVRCLAIAAALERHAGHPLARAFAHLEPAAGMRDVRCIPGRGVEGFIDAMRYRIGRADFVLEGCSAVAGAGATNASSDAPGIVLGDPEGPLAVFQVSDALRLDARPTLARLRHLGLQPEIASGDQPGAVAAVAQRLGGIAARADQSAGDKLRRVQEMQLQGHRVVVVGDGVNDAPVLAAADVSASVASGTDVAKVTADVVLLGDGIGGLVDAVQTSRCMLRVIRQNLTWAVLYNLTAVPLAASGHLAPWMAAIGMSMSSLLVVLNAMRLLKARSPRVTERGHDPALDPRAICP